MKKLWQNWDDSAWVNSYKNSYTFDGNNNLIEDLNQNWDGSGWLNIIKNTYSYIPTGVEQLEGEVSTYSLSNNYPNPFNPSTVINYQLPVVTNVTLKVYDVLGNEVATLVNEDKPAGNYEVEFDGIGLSSGIYFYKLQAENYSSVKKMILLR